LLSITGIYSSTRYSEGIGRVSAVGGHYSKFI